MNVTQINLSAEVESSMGNSPYLEVVSEGDAKGQNLGRLPRSIKLQDLRLLGHPETPIKAIRAKCIECSAAAWPRPVCAISRIARAGPSGWVTTRSSARRTTKNDRC